MINRYEAIGVILMAGAVALAAPVKAEGFRVEVSRGVPAVAGLPRPPVAHDAYRTGQARVSLRPRAGILDVPGGAPANGCAVPAFEVVSGPKAERGCYGALSYGR